MAHQKQYPLIHGAKGPYLHSTRETTDDYAHEMTEGQHAELLEACKRCVGKVMLSGYRSELYDDALSRWTRHDFDVPNHASAKASKARMVESLWVNW